MFILTSYQVYCSQAVPVKLFFFGTAGNGRTQTHRSRPRRHRGREHAAMSSTFLTALPDGISVEPNEEEEQGGAVCGFFRSGGMFWGLYAKQRAGHAPHRPPHPCRRRHHRAHCIPARRPPLAFAWSSMLPNQCPRAPCPPHLTTLRWQPWCN